MNPITRRELLAIASAFALHGATGETKPRPKRSECFFGLHFDLHPVPADMALGADVTEQMIESLLRSCKPDFIQYDSKGHPGYLGFPSKTGMSAPHIIQDSLAIWRRVTARHGVALYNHFSGVLDGLAVAKHPEWARVKPDGTRDSQETSTFSAYEAELMIPELRDAALNYDLDGSWVDGDCWAINPDYILPSVERFRQKTGLPQAPKNHGEDGWLAFLELQREQFRQYVAKYVDALHSAKPGYQITSNWMYSTFMPERPAIPVDYLSGDIADQAPVRRARMESRYLASCGVTWDLMSWGFETDPKFGEASTKPPAGLKQEAAIVLAQGGAYQIYYTPTRRGWIDERIIREAGEVAGFCRARQALSHKSETVPEAAVLFSSRSLYNSGDRVFGPWGRAAAPAEGAVDLLISAGYSTDIVPDWKARDVLARYPLAVLPDWDDIGQELEGAVVEYVKNGGHLLICGARNCKLLGPQFGLQTSGDVQRQEMLLAGEFGFVSLDGDWIRLQAGGEKVLENVYRSEDTRKEQWPLAVGGTYGSGKFVACAGPLASAYGLNRAALLVSAVREMLASLRAPMVKISPRRAALEVVGRRMNGDLTIHIINLDGAQVSSEYRHSGYVSPTGDLQIEVRLPRVPAAVWLEPEHRKLDGVYSDGVWRGTAPSIEIHGILHFVQNG